MFRYETLSEWSELSSQARGNGEEIHFGFLFGLLVEKKGAEFPVGDERRKFKYRIVFRGNDVKDQSWEVVFSGDGIDTDDTIGFTLL